jgi:hypothetical protein
MAQNKFYDFAKRNPVITGVGTLTVGFIIYRVVKRLTSPEERIPPKPPIPEIPPAERKYSYSSEQYAEWADSLQQAFDGAGTDEDRIRTIMQYMKTKGDVVALISAYGRRVVSSGFGWDSSPMTLSQAITDEMSKGDIEKYVNIPISKTGFKF